MHMEGPGWTVLKLLGWTRDFFARARLEDPRLSAEILLGHALGCDRVGLYTRFDYQPTKEQLAAFRELIRRARRFEPIAYLIGRKEFYSLRFKVAPSVLVPRPETEVLVSEAVAHLRKLPHAGRVWDVATGSGCVAVAIAVQAAGASVLATDVSQAAVAIAAENAAAHNVADRVKCLRADLMNLPAESGDARDFDVITANPPYVPDGQEVAEPVKHEPPTAVFGGPDGLGFIRPIVRDSGGFLRSGGALVMEFGAGQAQAVGGLVEQAGCFAQVRLIRDHAGIERVVVAVRK
jgi:release factor glutamine methyltransferase